MALPIFVVFRGAAEGVPLALLAACGFLAVAAARAVMLRWRRNRTRELEERCAHLVQANDRLEEAKERAFELFHNQMAASKKRTSQIQKVFELSNLINSELDLEHVLQTVVNAVRECLGYRIVLLRALDEERDVFQARAFAGLPYDAISMLERYEVLREEFESWIQERFRISNSYFISHEWNFWSKEDDELAYVPNLGERREGEWHQDDVLFVPMRTREGKLIAYMSVDDPGDRRLPTLEMIETLELFANEGATAIQNATLYRHLEENMHQIKATAERMRELNELKSNFVSTVSHELRTPLTSIRAYVETLLDAGETIDGPTRQEFLGIINEESARLARLIDAVLDLSKLEAGKLTVRREPLSLSRLIEEVMDVIRPMAEKKRLVLESSFPSGEVQIEADHDLMKQVFLNLTGNAIKFTPEGGRITLSADKKSGIVEIAIEDTGIGIPEDKLDRIFDRFYQVDGSNVRRFGGSGLGLSITKSIVEWHGGEIRAESKDGGGTRFVIAFGGSPDGGTPIAFPVNRSSGFSDALSRAMVSMVASMFDARLVSFLALEDDGLTLAVRASIGIEEKAAREARIPVGEAGYGWVAQHGKELLIEDLDSDGRFQKASAAICCGAKSLVSVPVRWAGEVIGVLNVSNKADGAPMNEHDLRLLMALSERIGNAWDLVSKGSPTQGRSRLIRECFTALDLNARRTRRGLHAGTRADLAFALGQQLGFGPASSRQLVYAAAVHEVGMGFMSEDVLGENRPLVPDEWMLLTNHPEAGARILRSIEVSPELLSWVETHHERPDGEGYPHGLRGDQIPLGARALSVLDAFDSMTRGRPYREAVSNEQALRELTAHAGTQFDAAVIEALEQVLAGTLVETQAGGRLL
jgi:signal transduction histidine kinase/HD-GYP domain-containing protein (c-di-GMP phosphodiesterase class II)